ncbi:MAG: conjugal transfer protein TraX [Lachnospiraceae bacterium]|nr:conjugal transfer protein TraX [Lachnospiraceae bacterium]
MNTVNKGLSGSALKWIAIVTMLIDHIGAVVLTRMLLNYQYDTAMSVSPEEYNLLYQTMYATRLIGRVAFPIFCFLLVEGFLRTGNVYKYMLRLGIFAVITEIPFDLAFSAQPVYWGYQSVMLTLLIGVLTMYGCSQVEKRCGSKRLLMVLGDSLFVAVGMFAAYCLNTDYAEKGIACIMVLYFFRNNKWLQVLAGALSFCWEATAIFAFPFIKLYNGTRGMKLKYFFYLFYPLHLLVLHILCMFWGIEWIAVV